MSLEFMNWDIGQPVINSDHNAYELSISFFISDKNSTRKVFELGKHPCSDSEIYIKRYTRGHTDIIAFVLNPNFNIKTRRCCDIAN